VHLDLAVWLNLISTLAIVGALIFTGLQVRAANQSRKDQAALEMIRTALSENSARGIELFGIIPENAPPNLIEDMPAQTRLHIFEFGIRFEMIGYMVYRGLLDLKAVDDLAGGTLIGFWLRVKGWAADRRARTGHHEFLEWLEWVALQLEKRRADQPYMPAYKQHLDWHR
jgi:hypothetical protein